MAFSAGTDRVVLAAAWVGAAALAIAALLMLEVVWLRMRHAARDRRRERLFASWRPLLFEALVGGEPPLPSVERRDEEDFLLLWCQIQDGLRGEPRTGLNRLADAVAAREMARRHLRRGDALGRILALRTLGYLGHAPEREEVSRLLDDRRAYVCLAAARSLAMLDPGGAASELLPRLAARADWPVSQLANVFRQLPPEGLAAEFDRLRAGLSTDQLVRLLPLLAEFPRPAANRLLAELLSAADDPELLCAALKRVDDATLLPHVLRLAAHEGWPVRTQAAAALGRAGGSSDRPVLLRLICDPQWWVRYRAAQALIGGRFGTAEEIAGLAAGLPDPFARDIVQHAIAEAGR